MKEFIVKLKNKTIWEENFSACIGYFDGIHRGHQKLIETALEEAKTRNIKLAMISFEPDPWITLGIKTNVQHIVPLKLRKQLAASFGVDYWITLEFTKEMANLSPEEFISLLNEMPLEVLVCGFDFNYGKKGEGNIQTLLAAKRKFDFINLAPVTDKGVKISTTLISELIVNGQIEEANSLLGYPLPLVGTVTHGKKIGREIGFPTANLSYSNECLLPKEGVYAGKAFLNNESYLAMINIGKNPTIGSRENNSLEVHILNFCGDIYEHELKIEFYTRIRDEIKFSSIDELKLQLKKDRDFTKDFTYE